MEGRWVSDERNFFILPPGGYSGSQPCVCVCVTGGTCRRGERVTLPVMDGSVGGADSLIVVISFPHPALFTLTVISGNISMAERWQGSRGGEGAGGCLLAERKKGKEKA